MDFWQAIFLVILFWVIKDHVYKFAEDKIKRFLRHSLAFSKVNSKSNQSIELYNFKNDFLEESYDPKISPNRPTKFSSGVQNNFQSSNSGYQPNIFKNIGGSPKPLNPIHSSPLFKNSDAPVFPSTIRKQNEAEFKSSLHKKPIEKTETKPTVTFFDGIPSKKPEYSKKPFEATAERGSSPSFGSQRDTTLTLSSSNNKEGGQNGGNTSSGKKVVHDTQNSQLPVTKPFTLSSLDIINHGLDNSTKENIGDFINMIGKKEIVSPPSARKSRRTESFGTSKFSFDRIMNQLNSNNSIKNMPPPQSDNNQRSKSANSRGNNQVPDRNESLSLSLNSRAYKAKIIDEDVEKLSYDGIATAEIMNFYSKWTEEQANLLNQKKIYTFPIPLINYIYEDPVKIGNLVSRYVADLRKVIQDFKKYFFLFEKHPMEWVLIEFTPAEEQFLIFIIKNTKTPKSDMDLRLETLFRKLQEFFNIVYKEQKGYKFRLEYDMPTCHRATDSGLYALECYRRRVFNMDLFMGSFGSKEIAELRDTILKLVKKKIF